MTQYPGRFVTGRFVILERIALMILSLAPMEGVTDGTFRRVHVACFGALDY